MATATLPAFVDHCLELLGPLGRMRAKRMFGGWGLYADELFVAIIAFDRLYLKADDDAKRQFADAGAQRFVHDAAGKQMTMGYWTAPDDAMDSPALMQPWARLALRAAVAARAAKPARQLQDAAVRQLPKAARKRAARQAATSTPAKKAAARKVATKLPKKRPPG